MNVTMGQLNYEVLHLLNKLHRRDAKKYGELKKETEIDTHPLFKKVPGDIEDWEVVTGKNDGQ